MRPFELTNEAILPVVVGLGYVGLSLALALGRHFNCIGYDKDHKRVKQLTEQRDVNQEVAANHFKQAKGLTFTASNKPIVSGNFYIVAIATPVDQQNQPDLTQVLEAAKDIAPSIQRGDIVVLESTVYPGFTLGEFRQCLEQTTGLIADRDFYLGYSPERINPADSQHGLQQIVKPLSATQTSTLDVMAFVYDQIIDAGIYLVDCIKTAELSKLVENSQRDVNVAFINEILMLADKLGLDIDKILACAQTKWNFLNFRPGLVGGHCVAVDPYYLKYSQVTHDAKGQVIEQARATNEFMVSYVVNEFIKRLVKMEQPLTKLNILVIGVSFKPNCPDCRNSKAIAVINELLEYDLKLTVFDPISHHHGESLRFDVHNELSVQPFDAVLLLVAHTQGLRTIKETNQNLLKSGGVFYCLDDHYKDLFK